MQLTPDWLDKSPCAPVLAALSAHGADVRVVGGAVRDALLGRPVKDIDMATPDTPDIVTSLLNDAGIKCVATGIEHGTITAVAGGQPVQVTTLRHDITTDGRHAEVAFGTSWEADATRRDFTMNALSLGADGMIHDPVGGIDDARTGRVRFIGNAGQRIEEDYLRILRFFRFFASHGQGAPDTEALAACAAHKEGIAGLSAERIAAELMKLLNARDPFPTLELMNDTDVLSTCLPAAELHPDVSRICTQSLDPRLRLAALVRDGSREEMARALKLSGEETRYMAALDRHTGLFSMTRSHTDLMENLYDLGSELVMDLAILRDAPAQVRAQITDFKAIPFPVSGQDLITAGLPSGPKVGELLKSIRRRWIEAGRPPDAQDILAEALKTAGLP